MKTKPEIKEKLKQAEEALKRDFHVEVKQLTGVIVALRWVLGVKTTQEPKDPVAES